MVVFFEDRGCRGLNLNGVIETLTVGSADDSATVTYSANNLTKILTALEAYCDRNGLKVNVQKTKILICKNTGKLGRKPHIFLYKGQKVEAVKSYVYLGIPFNSTVSSSLAAEAATKKAKIAGGVVLATLAKLESDTWSSKKNIFDSMVMATLLYQAHIEGLNDNLLEKLETAHLYFFKRLFFLPMCTPNYALRLELGIDYISTRIIKLAVNWIIRALKMDDFRLTKKCLSRLIESSQPGSELFNWISRLRTLLKPINEDSILNNLSLLLWMRQLKSMIDKNLINIDRNRYAESRTLQLIYPRFEFTPKARLLYICPYRYAKLKIQLRLANAFAANKTINSTTREKQIICGHI